MALYPVGIVPLTLQMDTLFTPALKEDQSFYLSIYLRTLFIYYIYYIIISY